jgi:hypothetical protein
MTTGSDARAHGSAVSRAFFSGGIRDNTTKQSRKAADTVAMFKRKMKNPEWVPVDSRGAKVSLDKVDIAQACLQVKTTIAKNVVQVAAPAGVPASCATDTVVGSILGPQLDSVASTASAGAGISYGKRSSFGGGRHCRGDSFTSGPHAFMQRDVHADVYRRIRELVASGENFEKGVHYVHGCNDARDAELIIHGIDPSMVHCTERMVQQRVIPVERKHFYASFPHRHIMTPRGIAYVHTDGSIAIFPHGRATMCKCGALHMS